MENKKLWNSVKTVPGYAKKKITGGRLSGMTDIKPQWRLEVLTEQFGPAGIGWYYETVSRETFVADAGTVSVSVAINLYVKTGEEWSKPIEGIGGSMLVAKEKNGLYHSDEAYKMATTDAISVACKQLGIAADVYMGEEYSKYMSATFKYQEQVEKIGAAETLDALRVAFTAAYAVVDGNEAAQRVLIDEKNKRKAELS